MSISWLSLELLNLSAGLRGQMKALLMPLLFLKFDHFLLGLRGQACDFSCDISRMEVTFLKRRSYLISIDFAGFAIFNMGLLISPLKYIAFHRKCMVRQQKSMDNVKSMEYRFSLLSVPLRTLDTNEPGKVYERITCRFHEQFQRVFQWKSDCIEKHGRNTSSTMNST